MRLSFGGYVMDEYLYNRITERQHGAPGFGFWIYAAIIVLHIHTRTIAPSLESTTIIHYHSSPQTLARCYTCYAIRLAVKLAIRLEKAHGFFWPTPCGLRWRSTCVFWGILLL